MKELVQADLVAERGCDPVETLGVQEQHLDRDRLAVGEAQSLDAEHLGLGVEPQHRRHLDTRLDATDGDQLRARADDAGTHPLAVARQPERLLDLRERDEGPLALTAEDPLLGFEALKHVADRRARDAVLGTELALGRKRCAGKTVADQLEQRLAQPTRLQRCNRPRCSLRVAQYRARPREKSPDLTITNLTIPIRICKITLAHWSSEEGNVWSGFQVSRPARSRSSVRARSQPLR